MKSILCSISLHVILPTTGGELQWKPLPLGLVDLPEEETILELKPEGENWQPINLRKIRLTPAVQK